MICAIFFSLIASREMKSLLRKPARSEQTGIPLPSTKITGASRSQSEYWGGIAIPRKLPGFLGYNEDLLDVIREKNVAQVIRNQTHPR